MDKYKDLAYSYYNKAINLLENNSITEAVEQLKKSVRIYAQDTDRLNLLGLCYYYKCDFKEAKKLWNMSLSITEENDAVKYVEMINDPEFTNLLNLYNKALNLVQKNRYKKGISLFKKIINQR